MNTPSNGTTPSTALTVHHVSAPAPVAAFEPSNLPELYDLCNTLARSTLIPPALRGKPADIAIIVMTGRELGLSVMQSLRSIHVINGRGVLSADLIAGLCLRSSACRFFRLVASDGKGATYETLRDGSPEPVRLSFTIEQARQANLTSKDTWKAYPDAMLRARCAAALARAVFPDLVAGLYDPDEGDDMRRREQPQRQAQQVSVRVAPTAEESPEPAAATESTVTYDEQTGEVLDEQAAPVIAPPAAQPADGIGADLARLDACASMPEVMTVGKELVMRHKGTPQFADVNRAISAKQQQLRNGGAK